VFTATESTARPSTRECETLHRTPDRAVAVGAPLRGGGRRTRGRWRRRREDWHQVREGERAPAHGTRGRPGTWPPGRAHVARTRTVRRLHAAPRDAGREVLCVDGVFADAADPA